jgi:hypothetical protein
MPSKRVAHAAVKQPEKPKTPAKASAVIQAKGVKTKK